MKITELLKADTIRLDLNATSKAEALDELAMTLADAGRLNDYNAYRDAIQAREEQTSTGIGEGIAIPHAKSAAVKTPAIAFGRSKAGLDFDSLDQQPAHLFFMIAASEGANNDHLQTLSRLSTLLMDESFRQQLLDAKSTEDVLHAVNAAEADKLAKEDEPPEAEAASTDGGPRVLAVTACPTGIAHTYMAADALKDKAKGLNISIKVETNGSDGVRNRLTDEEIANADGIIVAADTKVELARFDGKPVIITGVTDGIRKPEELIRKAAAKDAPVYKAEGQRGSEAATGTGRGAGGFYKHLMNGVSNMLPFVVGGGVLMAISFFFGINSADPTDPTYNQFAEALKVIGGDHAFGLMIAVLAGFIAMSIAERPGFAPGMIGGFIATTTDAGFLGGLIAGFLAGYIVLGLKQLLAGLPKTLDGIKTILFYPVLSIFATGMIMWFVVAGPVSWLNTNLADWLNGMSTGNIIILGLILGGMMAVDMGGPLNKTAFTFGIAMIDAGNFAPHAAIMAGGMVPPLGLALATTLFRNKFTKVERDAGKTSYVLGAFFITEGAIPIAAADPARIIPSIVVGSGIAGALTMLFGIGLPAPHGGVFVFPVVIGSAWLYLLAIAIGAVVSALMVGLLKKPIKN
ncbi:PTS fructose transporter subunit IIABC [Aureibacillus halotolerans]|uniref:PTS system D-fructose-specific IIA component (F1P-forming) (Frc family) /PTS system D-fructose-specific IIB component (F1P-forming) (Frc family) /PTS system D-fructose-specific IIC component (F1P-f... n=1 Tax=Aureibacillus halotolerans TaxID=1508390 RepID=A0A4R6UDL2_9BACI|nr:PTS fructose transporter subunit IIABC [Aureibacillus halotolerans]TDQ42885.1 PTS system D-fructose-specific IIA component (F1P-forming) (Frc family) /PTS system D-fructose-specific IIB component (F1P-forming) (Frc family) /PTS system D-fructose-specific IIC component (F1P-forming) (Frc family) [Aureibacillus halotolerans]